MIAISASEELRHAHWEVSGVLKPRSLSTLNHIEVDDKDCPGKIKAIHDKEEMNDKMMEVFKSKFMEVYDWYMNPSAHCLDKMV